MNTSLRAWGVTTASIGVWGSGWRADNRQAQATFWLSPPSQEWAGEMSPRVRGECRELPHLWLAHGDGCLSKIQRRATRRAGAAPRRPGQPVYSPFVVGQGWPVCVLLKLSGPEAPVAFL